MGSTLSCHFARLSRMTKSANMNCTGLAALASEARVIL